MCQINVVERNQISPELVTSGHVTQRIQTVRHFTSTGGLYVVASLPRGQTAVKNTVSATELCKIYSAVKHHLLYIILFFHVILSTNIISLFNL